MATSTTGDFWNTDDPYKPIGEFLDPDSELDIPFVIEFWFDTDGKPKDLDPGRCAVDGFEAFDCNIQAIIKNIINVRVKRKEGVSLTTNKIYPIRLSFGLSDGQLHHKTFWLLVKKG